MALTPNRNLKTVQVVGGNLFALAAVELGDATQWNRIASLNGLADPIISGLMTLTIPPPDRNAGNGGILDYLRAAFVDINPLPAPSQTGGPTLPIIINPVVGGSSPSLDFSQSPNSEYLTIL